MIRSRCLSLVVAALCCMLITNTADAQILKRLFGTKQVGAAKADDCPGGFCPDKQFAAVSAMQQDSKPGHWSYPGTIDNHLESTHGVATAGMTRQQKLNLHDALHEGTAMPQAIYQPQRQAAYPAVTGYKSGGSSGGTAFAVGNRDPQGHVITSIGNPIQTAQAESVPFATPSDLQLFSAGNGGGRRDFKRDVLTQAKQQVEDGMMTEKDFRALRLALNIPGVPARMEATLEAEARDRGIAKGSVDWIALIKELLPVILQIIQLFANESPVVPYAPYVDIESPSLAPTLTSTSTIEWYSAA